MIRESEMHLALFQGRPTVVSITILESEQP